MTSPDSSPALRTPVLTGFLVAIAAAVLSQAVLAGQFISGSADVRTLHLIVGSALPWLALVPAVIAWVRAAQRVIPKSFAVLVTVLTVAIWVQDALGHIGFPATTAVHIPLGVAIFALSVALVIVSFRRREQRA